MTGDSLPPPERNDEMVATGIDADRVWFGVAGRMWETPRGPLERWLGRFTGNVAIARALVATPSLFVAWAIASVAILGLGAVLGSGGDQPFVPLLAPIVAAIGVSLAYGPAADPAWEITRSVALPAHLLLLARVTAVFATNAAIGIVASLATGYGGAIVVVWLLPMTAVALVALGVTLRSGSSTLGSGVGMVAWLAILLRDTALHQRTMPRVDPALIERTLPLLAACAVVGLTLVLLALNETRLRGVRR